MRRSVSILSWCLAWCLLLLLTGCNPMKAFYNEIGKAGYIPFRNVITHSATGALVGGSPRRLQLVAPPETCFPTAIDGVETKLRFRDESQLPNQSRYVSVGFKANVQILKGISAANGTLSAGVQFNHIEMMELSFEGVHVEYMDSVVLAEFYRNRMPALCKDFLDNYAVIIQAIQADKMKFTFYTKDLVAVQLSMENIKEIVDISADLKYEITNGVELVITTPKYLGYQLGKLQRADNGIALWRASRASGDRFVFDWIRLFENPEISPSGLREQPFAVEDNDFLPADPGAGIRIL